MGKHYIPQEYLRGFADPHRPKLIWQFDKQFDKQTGEFSDDALSIKRVAQQRDYYEPVTEKKLTEFVEGPGNVVLKKLRSGDFNLSEHDRVHLAVYVATMLNRVPRSRDRGHEIAPKALAKVSSELRQQIRAAQEAGLISPALAEKHLRETDEVEANLSLSTPPSVMGQIESPWPTERTVQLILGMHWRFVVTDGPSHFLTSDNPAFFFECWGLGNDASELTFPISHEIALFGSGTPIAKPSARIIKCDKFVKEANSRLASGATRFVYCRSKAPWVAKIVMKQTKDLNRIQW